MLGRFAKLASEAVQCGGLELVCCDNNSPDEQTCMYSIYLRATVDTPWCVDVFLLVISPCWVCCQAAPDRIGTFVLACWGLALEAACWGLGTLCWPVYT